MIVEKNVPEIVADFEKKFFYENVSEQSISNLQGIYEEGASALYTLSSLIEPLKQSMYVQILTYEPLRAVPVLGVFEHPLEVFYALEFTGKEDDNAFPICFGFSIDCDGNAKFVHRAVDECDRVMTPCATMADVANRLFSRPLEYF